jgi:DNA-binding SARP family transcriptional activator
MYRLVIFGGIDLVGPSGPLKGRIAQSRPLALLAMLARASGVPLSRNKAVGILWPDVLERRARRRLSDTLYVIRRELGEGAVIRVADRLRLNSDVVGSDGADFEKALLNQEWEEAVAHYTGPFLEGFHLGGTSRFERWVQEERLLLADAYLGALERLAEAAEARGDWPEAQRWWKRKAIEVPTDSRVTLRLMEALVSAGSVPGALEQARRHQRVLHEELGVDLSAEVRSFAEELAGPRAL